MDLTDALSFIHMVVNKFPTVSKIYVKVNTDHSQMEDFFKYAFPCVL